jgi:hypothetical protein
MKPNSKLKATVGHDAKLAPVPERPGKRGEVEASIWWLLGLVIVSTAAVTWKVVSYIEGGIHQAGKLTIEIEVKRLEHQLEDLNETINVEMRERKSAEAARDYWKLQSQRISHENQPRESPPSPRRSYRAISFPVYIDRAMIRDYQSAYDTDPTPYLGPIKIAEAPNEFSRGVLALHPPESGKAFAELSIPAGAKSFRVDAALKGPCSGADWGSVNVWIKVGDSASTPEVKKILKKGQARETYNLTIPTEAQRLTLFADSSDDGYWCDDLFWLEGRFFD